MKRALLLFLLTVAGAGKLLGQPFPGFIGTPLSGCPPVVVQFTDNSTGSITGWSWDFGNGQTSNVQNPTTSYLAPGSYNVKLTVSNGTASNSLTKSAYITVKTPPAVSFSATPLAACPGVPISFTSSVTWNASGTGNYIWDFGDGGTSAIANPTHSYASGGTYTVKLTAVNSASCPHTDTQVNYITIYPSPSVNFYATDTAVCSLGVTTTFISTTTGGGPFSYIWDFGDGSGPSTAASPVSHAYYTPGSYSVKLIATSANGCNDSNKKNNYIRVTTVHAAASVPASACVLSGVNVSSAGTTTPGAALSWDFGDGHTATGPSAANIYQNAGTYTIRLIARNGGCSDTASNTIIINPRPVASFTYSPAFPCPAPSQITFTNTTTATGSYNSSWDFGDGFTSTAGSPVHTYTRDTIFTVKLTVTSSSGCTSNMIQQLTILGALFSIHANPPGGCVPATIKLSDTLLAVPPPGSPSGPYLYPVPHTSWAWSFGDGSPGSSASAPAHTYFNTGNYNVTLAITTANGCNFYDTFVVHIGNHATPNFGTPQRNLCNNTQIQFFDSSISPNGPLTSWTWFFGNGGFAVAQNPYYTYTAPGTYNVTLITNQNGCLDTITKLNYITIGYPGSKPRFHVSCDTLGLVHFVDSSVGATSMLWRFGDGTTSILTNPTHQYAVPGVYFASQITYNTTTGCKDSVTTTVIINNLTVNMSALDSNVCPHDTIQLAPVIGGASASIASILKEVNWTVPGFPTFFHNIYMPNGVYVAHVRGRYNIGVTVVDLNGCPFSKTNNNFITVGGPIPGFKATPLIGCAPATIVLTDTSNYVSSTFPARYEWDFGNGSTLVVNNPLGPSYTAFYPTIGGYGVKLIVTDNIGCRDSLAKLNYVVISHPTALFGTQGSTACLGAPFHFYSSSTGTGITHLWSFGDGTTSNVPSPSHVYTTPGTYTIRLIVTDYAGCRDTAYQTAGVSVVAPPHASFTMDDTLNVCPPLITNFTNTSTGGAFYSWSFGNSTSSALFSPSATYSAPGLYTIRLVVTNTAGCTDTAYGHAQVLGYAGVLSYGPLSGCAPFTVTFNAKNVASVPGFIYNFGDGTTSATTASIITHTYTTPGPHLPVLTMTDNLGCSAMSVGIDTVRVDGVFAGFTFSPFPACDKGTIQFRDTSRGAYTPLNPPRWAFHDGTSSNLATPSKTYNGPGTYPVVLYSSTTGGCRDTFRSNVIFYPLPTIFAGDDTTICLSDSAVLKPFGGVSYTWSPAGSLSCAGCTHPYAYPATPTTYTVVGKDAHGCTNTDTITVRLRYKTVTEVKPVSKEICSGDTVAIAATGGQSFYQWSPPDSLGSPTSGNTIAYPVSSQHYMLISRYAGCLPDTDYVDIVVHPTPTVKASAGQTIMAGTPIRLEASATGTIAEWLWTPSDGLFTPTMAGTDAFPKGSTTYRITVKTEFGCLATDTVRIMVFCDNSQVYLPNTFTPDGNGVNDVFYPRGRGLSNIARFRIYNRWGELVFERANIAVDDKANGWDGKKAGHILSPDIYVYTIEATCDTGEPLKWQGDVMLLR